MGNSEYRNTYLACTSVNLMALITGIGYSWSSPCIPKLQGVVDPENNPLGRPATMEEISWITSLHALGSLAGPLFTGIVSKKIGKKKTLIIFSLPQVASSIIMIFAYKVTHFYLARFLLGIGTGCVFSIIPSYVGEIYESSIRGRTSMINSILLTAGQTLVLSVGPYVTIRTISLITLSISVLFLFTFSYFVPESPYHYVMHGKVEKAKTTLKRWRRSKSTEKELLDIIEICDESQLHSLKEILTSRILRKCLIISLGLVSIQSLVGNPAIVAYQQTILDSTKNSIPGDTSVMIISILQLIGTYWSAGLVDKWGRKQLLFISYLGVLVSLVFLGGYYFLLDLKVNVDHLFWVPFATVLSYIVFYKIGAGPLPWTLCGEIFPPSFKPHLSTLTALVMTSVNFLVTLVFPYFTVILGLGWTMWIFAGFSLVSLIYVIFAVPETKGKSLIEIQRMLLEGKVAISTIDEEIISLKEHDILHPSNVQVDGR